jgi:hypothetical protein
MRTRLLVALMFGVTLGLVWWGLDALFGKQLLGPVGVGLVGGFTYLIALVDEHEGRWRR